ncbi:MAG: hypothetical protein OXB95_02785, partial [Rhodobacteraceae bacterium]|nr:hypothetical protein [Paracoccaceae bacterium]
MKLTRSELAMGSAAFLVETVNQLADAYLECRQRELGERIPHERLVFERQRVRAFITDRNVYGVDLNPIACELGEISLWLNGIHEGDFVPWFGDQLFTGNSLIGARAAVHRCDLLRRGLKVRERWHAHAPRQLGVDAPRRKHEVHHFLLPDPAMAAVSLQSFGHRETDLRVKRLRRWRSGFCRPFASHEVAFLQQLSLRVDDLLKINAEAQRSLRRMNNDPIGIYGQRAEGDGSVHGEKERRLAKLKASTAHGRLKLAMDYWCALWFWPLDEVDLLPSREAFLAEMHLILHGRQPRDAFDMLGSERMWEMLSREARTLFALSGDAEIEPEALVRHNPRLRVVNSVSERERFFHWPLELGDILLLDGGFDLVIGNPPWIKLNWSDKLHLSTFDPRLELRRTTSFEAMWQRSSLLSKPEWRDRYIADFRAFEGGRKFLAARQNYHLTTGDTNLYKCFVEKSFVLVKHNGRVGLLHPDGHFAGTLDTNLRREAYRRLIQHFQFRNTLNLRMFAGIDSRNEYSINIYRGHEREPSFKTIHNLFLPETVDACFAHDGIGDEVPGIKDANDD